MTHKSNNLINSEDKIYVAGHKGMVGSAIIRSLQKKGYRNILFAEKNQVDLTDKIMVENWFRKYKPDVVIIAAAKVGGILANNNYPVDFLLSNMQIQNNLIEVAWKNNIKRLLFLGSSCIYPKFANQPIKEESLLTGQLEETNQWYAIAKISGIKLCAALKKQYNFDSISLMPTNLYGPGDNFHKINSHVLPGLIRRFHDARLTDSKEIVCWGSGKPLREFLYVDDLGDACVYALEEWEPKGGEIQHLNVGSGKDISIRELASLIAKICNFNGKISWDTSKPDGTPRKLLDVSKFNNLGWSSQTSLFEGIEKTYKWFKDNLKNENLRI